MLGFGKVLHGCPFGILIVSYDWVRGAGIRRCYGRGENGKKWGRNKLYEGWWGEGTDVVKGVDK